MTLIISVGAGISDANARAQFENIAREHSERGFVTIRVTDPIKITLGTMSLFGLVERDAARIERNLAYLGIRCPAILSTGDEMQMIVHSSIANYLTDPRTCDFSQLSQGLSFERGRRQVTRFEHYIADKAFGMFAHFPEDTDDKFVLAKSSVPREPFSIERISPGEAENPANNYRLTTPELRDFLERVCLPETLEKLAFMRPAPAIVDGTASALLSRTVGRGFDD